MLKTQDYSHSRLFLCKINTKYIKELIKLLFFLYFRIEFNFLVLFNTAHIIYKKSVLECVFLNGLIISENDQAKSIDPYRFPISSKTQIFYSINFSTYVSSLSSALYIFKLNISTGSFVNSEWK